MPPEVGDAAAWKLRLPKVMEKVGMEQKAEAFPYTLSGGQKQRLALAACVMLLAACGFHPRGQATLPFSTLYVDGNTALLTELKRNIAAGTHNLMGQGEPFLERAVYYDRLTPESVDALAKLAREAGLTGLSMGMSSDYPTAVTIGATHVRVGSALFGARGSAAA